MKETALVVMGWRAQMDKLEQPKDDISHKHVKSTSTPIYY